MLQPVCDLPMGAAHQDGASPSGSRLWGLGAQLLVPNCALLVGV